ncbi:hypothetical protein ACFW6E_08695 [Streptomyces olivaceoviridis]|uniref:hypothetical protein n=1 Tax=Streptomyces olivaceoviridis TaxID=1921 RepID=UPI0036C54C13
MNDDMQPYERLATLTAHFTTEVTLDSWTWQSLYEYASGEVPEPAQIAEVTDLWAISPEGYGSTDIAFVARLTDGQWATCVAWSDTSGFGCQQGVDWRINSTREAAISRGLDKESRAHLGLALPGEETTR